VTQLRDPVDWIDTPDALAAAAARWRKAPALGIDTEFVRERTFYPRLGLLQVSDGTRSALIDPVALPDLEPLREVLADPAIVKVAHSPSEDLEVLFHRFGEFPSSLFDTQAAAAFIGLDAAMSYQRLVRELLAVELDKAETRTDWLRRPLSDAQVHYAAQDVELLLPLHELLRARLEAWGSKWHFRFTRYARRIDDGDFALMLQPSAVSVAKAARLLGYAPRTSLAEGMRRTESWLREVGHLPPIAGREAA